MTTLILISLAAFVATLLGGLFALRKSDKLHLVLGFSAGAVVAVAFFDLLPEALNLAGPTYGAFSVTSVVALGFMLFMIADRFVIPHTQHDDDCHNESHHRGVLGASSLSFHSFLDGLVIGFAFQVSTAVGAVAAVAVLVHDFSDGINTVSVILKNTPEHAGHAGQLDESKISGRKMSAFKWLAVDALAPVLGVIVGSFVTVQDSTLGILLALFSGFFLYIGASDLIPESHHVHPTYGTTVMTVLGVAVLYVAIRLAGL